MSAIQPSSHPAIQPSSHPAIQPSSHPAIQPSVASCSNRSCPVHSGVNASNVNRAASAAISAIQSPPSVPGVNPPNSVPPNQALPSKPIEYPFNAMDIDPEEAKAMIIPIQGKLNEWEARYNSLKNSSDKSLAVFYKVRSEIELLHKEMNFLTPRINSRKRLVTELQGVIAKGSQAKEARIGVAPVAGAAASPHAAAAAAAAAPAAAAAAPAAAPAGDSALSASSPVLEAK